MNPCRTAYGYMRTARDHGAASRLRRAAGCRGLHLDRIATEFADLMDLLDGSPDAVVVVSDLGHLAVLPSLQQALRARIEEGHELVVCDEDASAAPGGRS